MSLYVQVPYIEIKQRMPTLLNLMAYFRFYKYNTHTVPTIVNYQVKNLHYNLGS